MKTILTCFLLLTSFLTLTAHAQENGSLPVADFTDLRATEIAKVTAIIDPQTLQLHNGTIIRLAGIDFPDFDLHNPGEFSVIATAILRDMLEGKSISIYQTKNRNLGRINRMGHHIAHIERRSDKTWVQGSLIALGLARVRTSKRNPEMAEQMYKLEINARNEKLGLWDSDEFKIIAAKETINYLNSYQIVEGYIKSVAIKKNRIYLNFDDDWKTDFTVSIAPQDKRVFSKQGLDPLKWNGKLLRVRGRIEKYNGPYIEINHPQAIEIIDENPIVKTID